jgi:NhaP-type Na+/H+ or K+/H+ antiporter
MLFTGNEVLPWHCQNRVTLMTSVILVSQTSAFLCLREGSIRMLLSLALFFLCGMAMGKLFSWFRLPQLLGYLLTGILLGPHLLNLLDPTVLQISTELRQIALIIILARAGLNLDIRDLKKVGRPAVLLCFIPACAEILGMLILAPIVFHISLLEAAIMGAVIAAVSPAVVVPRMLKLMETGYGREKKIPQMLMAGASVDDVFAIVLFTAFVGLAKTGTISPIQFLTIPSSIILGLSGGVVAGLILSFLFEKIHIRDTGKVVVILSTSFLLVTLEHALTGVIGFSGLLAVMALGAMIQQKKYEASKRLSGKFSKLWVGAEVLLFVLVGATVNLTTVQKAGLLSAFLILAALAFRMIGVFFCLIGTGLSGKERLFSALAYMPKATVQAAIGGIPLALGLSCGDMVLTVAVLSIVITAPLGAILVDLSYRRLLTREEK